MQTRLMSFVETLTNTFIGFTTALVAQLFIFWVLGIKVPLETNFLLVTYFTIISLIRTYVVRRVFNYLGLRKKGLG